MKNIFTAYPDLCDRLRQEATFLPASALPSAAEWMAAAFCHDPSIRYLLGGQEQGDGDRDYFLTVLRAVWGKALLLSCTPDAQDLLVLFPPALKSVPATGFFRHGGAGLRRHFGLSLYTRSLRYENHCRRVKARFLTPDTWYCLCFAVAPERQGQGVGSRLLRPVLRALEDARFSLYLETHREDNVRIYGHFGFRTVDVSVIPGTDITQYAMLTGDIPPA